MKINLFVDDWICLVVLCTNMLSVWLWNQDSTENASQARVAQRHAVFGARNQCEGSLSWCIVPQALSVKKRRPVSSLFDSKSCHIAKRWRDCRDVLLEWTCLIITLVMFEVCYALRICKWSYLILWTTLRQAIMQIVSNQFKFKHLWNWGKFQQWWKFRYNNNNPVGKKPRRPQYAFPTLFWIPAKGSNKINKKRRTPSDPHLFTGCLGTNSQSLWTYEWSSDGGNQGAKNLPSQTGNVSLEKLHLPGFQSPPGLLYIYTFEAKKVNQNHHLPLDLYLKTLSFIDAFGEMEGWWEMCPNKMAQQHAGKCV